MEARDWHRLNNSIANFFQKLFLQGSVVVFTVVFVCLYVCLFVVVFFFNNRVIIDFV